MEMEGSGSGSSSSSRPRAVFMAFGTKGDVHPIAAIAAAFATDQTQYNVVLITHLAHQNLSPHLEAQHVSFFPISTPPVLSAQHDQVLESTVSFSMQKKAITREHRRYCLKAMERIFGDEPSMEGDFIVINFFALEGWNLAELFHVPCVVAAPYVVPYSAPSSFEHQFKRQLPLLYKYLQEAPDNMVCWKDVIHWMWPLFTEGWGSWRSELNLSHCPFTDPVTDLPMFHDWAQSPLLLYGFSKEIVECPGYWPSNSRVCGFWFPPLEWQFSCNECREISALVSPEYLDAKDQLCSIHAELHCFLETSTSGLPVFIGLSSIGSMGFLSNPQAFLRVLEAVALNKGYKFVLFSAGYEPLDAAVRLLAGELSCSNQKLCNRDGIVLFSGQVFCFSGNEESFSRNFAQAFQEGSAQIEIEASKIIHDVSSTHTIPYNWLFQRCAVAIHHGGSGSTAAALYAGIPQVLCPFMLDQFYWAERMFWLGVAPEPLQKNQLLPDKDDDTDIWKAANALSAVINSALSPRIKARASQIADKIASEDGVAEAVKVLKEEMVSSGTCKD